MNLRNWMGNIDDNRELLSLNLVGTHDCVTKYVQLSHFAQCQSTTIYEQLCLGVRALDIRVKSKGDRLVLVHGICKAFNSANHFSSQMDLAEVLSACYRFLEENKSEAIVFQFKNDDNTEQEKCFDNLINTYISKNADRWVTSNASPTLSQVRGRLLLIRRCKSSDKHNPDNSGIDFSKWVEQDEVIPDALELYAGGTDKLNFIIQDRYKYKPVERWSECIKPFLDNCTEFCEKYIVCYISTAGGFKGPKGNAKYINKKFLEYPLYKSRYYGIIYVDFVSRELSEKIITSNK